MSVKKSVKKLSSLRTLKARLLELAKTAEIYEELKLTLMLEGWNLDEWAVKDTVKKWLIVSLPYDRDRRFLAKILELGEHIDGETAARRCAVVKGMWEDVIGVENKEAAKIGLLQVVNAMDYRWNAVVMEVDDKTMEAVGKLVTWLWAMTWQ